MQITIYTKPGCKYCSQVKELMVRANLDYEEINVTNTELKEDFYSKYPSAKSYPYVIIDGEAVGGLVETAMIFVQRGLVSSKK
ncbi:glutaredoxin [Synechococcus phage S-PM2]|uniref:Glutaredoxin n=1 Tax=Synechococcus phage S-PM2 TaxID=238854 RepID=Q5GQF6_BPSYP|nr:thioredoxin domain [Synechococcus phage S-PM2]CAF34246.1 glutaredoxin [Synechococcus phage S-PM2]CFW42393.1 glutaredoxin [Synechococcus phage S-PM2]